MKILRFDSVGGASGDMILSALAAAGADLGAVRAQLATLDLEPFEIQEERVENHGLQGVRVSIAIPEHNHAPHRHLKHIRELAKVFRLQEIRKYLEEQL